MSNKVVLVSVCMLTYNHDKYIKQAIDGILMQKTDFDFELIICDDASPDRTNEIVNEILQNNPKSHIIRYYRHEKNIGMQANGEFVLNQTVGKYIAICEGDDYWTDSYKLSYQVEILENNNDVGLVHHDANYYYEKSKKTIKSYHKTKNIIIPNNNLFYDLIKYNKILTLTVLFRKELLENLYKLDSEFIKKSLMTDYIMWLEFSKHCSFYYIKKSMSTYRVLEESASRSGSYEKEINFLQSYCKIKRYFINKYNCSKELLYFVDQYEYSTALMLSIKHCQDLNALEYSKLLKADSIINFFKKYLVKFPVFFRFIIKFK
jgi:glycosyltransferase involved in cell wall biosynthesis